MESSNLPIAQDPIQSIKKEQPHSNQYNYPNIISQNRKAAVLLLILQIAIIVIYGFYLRVQNTTPSSFQQPYQLINVTPIALLALLAIPLSFGIIKNSIWSNLGFAILVVGITLQVHPLIAGVLGLSDLYNPPNSTLSSSSSRFNLYASNLNILDHQTQHITVTDALKCSIANVIAYVAIMGRSGPLQVIFVAIVGSGLYEVNRQLVSRWGMELGTSITIFLLGGITGGVMSMILLCKQGRSVDDHRMFVAGKMSLSIGGIGALLTWVFMPWLNLDIPSVLFYYHYAVLHSLLAISGCVLMVVTLNCIFFGRIDYLDLIYSPLAGGIAVSTNAVLCASPMEAIVLGFCSGILHFLMRRTGIGCGCLLDNGILMVVGMQGLFGGLVSAGLAYYDSFHARYRQLITTISSYPNGSTDMFTLPVWHDQLIAVGISVGVGLVGGLFLGLVMLCSVSTSRANYYHDEVYWSMQHSQISYKSHSYVVQAMREQQTRQGKRREGQSYESSTEHAMVEIDVSEGQDDIYSHVLL